MNITQKFGVSGEMRLTLHDGFGNRTRPGDYDADFKNLILNSGLDQLPVYGLSQPSSVASVGTSSTAPVVTQTGLISPLASTSNVISSTRTYVASPDPYMESVRVYRFAVGAAAGNLAEVGMSREGHTGAPAYSRALIKDSGGSPTILTVLSTEALDVQYTHRTYLPTNTQTGTVIEPTSGESYDFTSMLSRVVADTDVSPDGWMGIVWPNNSGSVMWNAPVYSAISNFGSQTVGITGTAIGTAAWSDSRDTYVGGTYARTLNVTSTIASIPTGNFAGGKIRWAATGPAMKVMFDPPIPIDVTQSIKLTVKVTFGRHA